MFHRTRKTSLGISKWEAAPILDIPTAHFSMPAAHVCTLFLCIVITLRMDTAKSISI